MIPSTTENVKEITGVKCKEPFQNRRRVSHQLREWCIMLETIPFASVLKIASSASF
jgi:hypothetical protein